MRWLLRIAGALALIAAWSCQRTPLRNSVPQTYYVDCAAGNDQATGTSPANAWRTLQRAGSQGLSPGDQVLLRRGATCPGMVALQGSGSASAPIRLSAYGEGPLPVVDAGGAPYALRLNNQHGWEISLVELRGGTLSGLSVSCDDDQVHSYFHLQNLVVHGVRGPAVTKRRGLVAIAPSSHTCTFEDIDIDGVTAFDSTQWAGIVVDGAYPPNRLDELESRHKRWRYKYWLPRAKVARNVAIRNSIVHDVAGDGIVVFRAQNATIESNLSWSAGMMERTLELGQNPNAMWTLLCSDCAIRDNEAFLTDTPQVDGGAFDIDWGCERSVIEYNYAHDNAGYCLAILGARNRITTSSVARYNVCVNNGRSPRMARRQGDVYFATWDKGGIDGLELYRNTFVWNPAADAPLFRMSDPHVVAPAVFLGSRARRISDNLAVCTGSEVGFIDPAIETRANLFWHAGMPDRPQIDPLLRPIASEPPSPAPAFDSKTIGFDAFRAPLASAESPFPGALLPPSEPLRAVPKGAKLLRVFIDPLRPDARRTVLLARSAAHQFGPIGLDVDIQLPLTASRNLPYDWHFGDLHHSFSDDFKAGATVELLDSAGAALMNWKQRPSPAGLDLALRWFVGTPLYSHPVKAPGDI